MKKSLLSVVICLLVLWLPSHAATFIVSSTGDTDNGQPYDVPSAAENTLRKCIRLAHSAGTGPHIIEFNIAGAPPYIINFSSQYDIGNQSIIIDATTQPGWTAGQPVVILRGNTGIIGFNVYNNTITFKGLIFQNLQRGIVLNGGANHVISGCWFGIDYAGTSKTGVAILEQGILNNGRTGVTIGGTTEAERNVISGCVSNSYSDGVRRGAIHLTNSSHNNTIIGNYIGPNAAGTGVIGNGIAEPVNQHGIYINNSSQAANPVIIENNVISGNTGNGIWADGNCFGVRIRGNKIGTDATGTVRMGNKAGGIRIDGGNSHYIGYDGNDATGNSVTKRNIISGNGYASDSRPCRGTWCGNPCTNCDEQYDGTLQCGIYFNDVDNSFIAGNYIGLKANGIDTCSNLYAGVKFENGSTGNTIGGATSDYRNVIGGNGFDYLSVTAPLTNYLGHGIQLNHAAVTNTTISNNYIGIGADGVTYAGNRQDGISLLGSKNNTISNNVISCNAWGIFLQTDFNGTGNGNQPSGNNIHSNYIGTDYTGNSSTGTAGVLLGNGRRTTPLDDDGGGIGLQHGSFSNNIGTTTGGVNVISGNRNGIVVRFPSAGNGGPPNNNTIQNNYIGIGADGTTALGNLENGIYFSGGATTNTIGGNAANTANYICNSGEHGISFNGALSNNIRNNIVGLNTAGAAAGNAQNGIYLYNGSQSNTIGGTTASVRNIISSNGANGIFVNEATTTSNTIRGNYIGTSIDGTADMGNGSNGIHVLNVSGTAATSTLIGGTGTGEGNVISGNNGMGVRIENSANSRIQGNYIGTNAAGTAGIGNGNHGLDILGTSNTCSILNNVISANGANGVFGFGNAISITDCGSHTVQGNYCGTDAAGTTALPNLNAGYSSTNSTSNTVGGTLSTQRNIFSGNADVGVYLNNSDNSTFVNNYIGLSSSAGALGNTNDGVVLENGSSGNRFGGINAGEGNRIAHNGDNGINISGATTNNNSIHRNSIYCNGARGIELNGTGNDNYTRPTITVASTATTLYGTAAPGATIEVFGIGASACATCPDDADRIQGKFFLGTATADGSGNWSYAYTGDRDTVVVTASVANANTGHNTSEFSACAPLCTSPPTPNAGLDQTLCETVPGPTVTTLTGSDPTGYTPTWSLLSGPGTANFSSANSQSTDVELSDPGVYTFQYSIGDGICPPSSATMTVTVNALPSTPLITGSASVCEETSGVTFSADPVIAGATYTWTLPAGATINGSATGNSILVDFAAGASSGTIEVFATVSGCADATPSSANITVNTRPVTPVVTGPATTCDEVTDIPFSADPVIPGATYTWTVPTGASINGASDGNSILVNFPAGTSSGTVTVSAALNGCEDLTPSSANITVNNRPETPVLTGPATTCDEIQDLVFSADPVIGGATYTWTLPTGVTIDGASDGYSITVDVTAGASGGTVTVAATANGCEDLTPSSVTLTVNNRPETPVVTGPATTCDDVTDIVFSADPVITNATYTWTVPTGASINGASDGNSVLVDFPAGTASGTVTVSAALNGCEDLTPSSANITVNNRPETPVLTGPATTCDEIQDLVFSADPVIGGATYTWTLPTGVTIDGVSDGNSITVDVAAGASGGTVTVAATANGCEDLTPSSVTLTINNRPSTPLISGPAAVCELSSNIIFSADPAITNATYTWTVPAGASINGASDGNSISVDFPAGTVSGTVTVSATLNGCEDLTPSSSNLTVDEQPDAADAGADQPSLCADNTTLSATPVASGNGQWFIISGTGTITDDTDPVSSVTDIATGTLTLEWVVSNGVCTPERDTVVIEKQPGLVTADAGSDKQTCLNTIVLTGNSAGGGTGTWTSPDPGVTFTAINDSTVSASGLTSGTTTFTWTIDAGACGNSSDDVIVTLTSSSVEVTASASKDTLCVGENASITATVSGTTATPVTYFWGSSDDSFNASFQGDLTTTIEVSPVESGWVRYTVAVADPNGCGNGAVDSVYSVGSQALVIPNLITPNGDDKNDCLQILDVDGYNIVPGSVYEIYNRWGQSVYKNEDYANGDFCGGDLADGMYFFYLKTSCDNREFKGWLHILSNTGASNK